MQQSVVWVHQQWQHDSQGTDPGANSLQILQRAKQGERFSCTEYGKVLRDVLISQGIVARTIGIQTPTIAYGPPGSAHVAVEAWSNNYQKWVLLDAQWGIIPMQQGRPINALEFYQLQQQNKLKQIALIGPGQELIQDYLDFMRAFNGYLSTSLRDRTIAANLIVPITGKELPLTFQGLPKNKRLFSRKPDDIYFSLNRVTAYLSFTHSRENQQAFAQMHYQSDGEYLQQMPGFAPEADFNIELSHNMPWFDHFEINTGSKDSWTAIKGSLFNWAAKSAAASLQVRAVNAAGIVGPATYFKLRIERD